MGLTVNMFVTLDGVIQGPGGQDEDREGGFAHGGWQAPFFDEESGAEIMKGIERLDALVVGRKTYEIWNAYWPKQPDDDPIARKFNAAPKYVASRTLDSVGWTGAHLVKGDLAAAVRKIKTDHDEVHVWGSAELVRSLLHDGLVDQLDLFVYPVVLGSGKRLFPEGMDPMRFERVGSRGFPGGAVMMRLAPKGPPTYGDMGAQQAEEAAA